MSKRIKKNSKKRKNYDEKKIKHNRNEINFTTTNKEKKPKIINNMKENINKNKNNKNKKIFQKKSQTHCHICKKLISRKNYRVHLFYKHKATGPNSLEKKKYISHKKDYILNEISKEKRQENNKSQNIDNLKDSDSEDENKNEGKSENKDVIQKEGRIFQKKKLVENEDSKSSSDDESIHNINNLNKTKKKLFYMHPDWQRIEKEVDDVIRNLEMKNKKNDKINLLKIKKKNK